MYLQNAQNRCRLCKTHRLHPGPTYFFSVMLIIIQNVVNLSNEFGVFPERQHYESWGKHQFSTSIHVDDRWQKHIVQRICHKANVFLMMYGLFRGCTRFIYIYCNMNSVLSWKTALCFLQRDTWSPSVVCLLCFCWIICGILCGWYWFPLRLSLQPEP